MKPDYSIQMEFDPWSFAPMQKTGSATYTGETTLEGELQTLDVITVHAHTENGSTLTVSSPDIRLE